jgi:D-threo-aldose 1-dehydrogenase
MSDEDAAATVDQAWDSGIRYFDTAPHYGLSLSERRLGAALRKYPRAEYAVSTKVGRLLVPNPTPTGSDLADGGFDVPDDRIRTMDFSADAVQRSIEESLDRLGLARIDIALVHDPEQHFEQALAETVPTLIKLREEGVLGAVGVGMNHWQPLRRFVSETDIDVVMMAGRWTLLDRSAAPLIEACVAAGVSVLAAAPFNSGLLAHEWPPDDAHFDYAPADPQVLAEVRRLAQICRTHGEVLPHAALRFPLRSPAVAAVVAGLATAEQVRSAVRWLDADLDGAAWSDLEATPVLPARRYDTWPPDTRLLDTPATEPTEPR